MNQSTFFNSEITVSNSAVASKMVSTRENNSTIIENIVNLQSAKTDEIRDATAESFVMRKLAPAMAKIEISSIRIACSVVDKSLTAAGNIAFGVGVVCHRAGERAHNAKPAKNGLEGTKVRKEGSIETSQG